MAERGFRRDRKKLDLGKYTLVTYKDTRGERFEIIVDPWAAVRYKRGEKISPDEVIVIEEVFKDVQKGILASIQDLRQIVFEGALSKFQEKKGRGATKKEVEQIRRQVEELEEDELKKYATRWILEDGELKLPDEVRDKLLEEKINKIVNFLAKFAINPATNAPYPRSKISEAIKKIFAGIKLGDKKIHIVVDPLAKDIRPILPKVLDALKMIMPIRIEAIECRIWVPPAYSGKVYSLIAHYGNVLKADWLDDGSVNVIAEVPAGLFLQLSNEIRKATKGSYRIEIIARRTEEEILRGKVS